MKNCCVKNLTIQLLLLCLILLFPASQAEAGPRAPGGVVTKLPHGYKQLKNGLFHHKRTYYQRGPAGFLIVAPPFGLIVSSLPLGYVSLTIGGFNYFTYQDVYYRPISNGYLVVEKPVETVLDDTIEHSDVGYKVTVFVDRLYLRSGPDKKHLVLQSMRKGTELIVIEVRDGWYFVELADEQTGWVMIRHTRQLFTPAKG